MNKAILILFATVTLEIFGQSPAPARQPAASGVAKPKLVVVIVADQFRYDYLLRFRKEYKEGLNQLLTKGAVFLNARYDHFPTFTSVGHAALLTGAFPSVNGIIGNQWYDRESGKVVSSAADESVRQVGGDGGRGASPRNLLVSTVGDELKMSGPGLNRVIGISLKDYSGILATGHMADAVYWFDARSGNFVSSSYYLQDIPQWVKDFNSSKPADKYKGMDWQGTRLSDEAGPKLYGMLQFMPFGNDLVEQMAESAIKAEQLGRDGEPDLLVLSFSSNDYVGHTHGPDSGQVREVSVATDQMLGKLFRFIDTQIGLSNVAVVFTADHGVAPMPEVNAKRKMPGGRVSFAVIRSVVQKRLEEKYGPGNWISSTPEDTIYLNWNLIRTSKLSLEEVIDEAAQAALDVPQVFRIYTRTQLTGGLGIRDQIGRRVMNGFSFRRGADLYVLLDPYFFYGAGGSTTHGTAFGYDNHVPLIFMGPGIKAGQIYESAVMNDVAPTLSAILGIETPSGSEGRILSEILAK